MTTLVDLRHWRIGAAPVRLRQPDAPCAPTSAATPALPDGAEIVLFPRIRCALLRRPRKSLKRRFARQVHVDSAGL